MENFLKFLFPVLVIVGVSTTAEANLIRLHFSTTATALPGGTLPNDPFGITAVPGVTHVQGFVLYDPSATPVPDHTTNTETFFFSITNGLRIKIGNTIITSSDYSITSENLVINIAGQGDHLDVESDSLTVSGVPVTTDGDGVHLDFRNSDGTLFRRDTDLDILPSRQTVSSKIDDFGGVIFGPNGSGSTGFLGFGSLSGLTQGVPDTGTTLLLLALGLAPVALLRCRAAS